MDSFAAWTRAIYSASVIDNIVVACFFEDHEIASFARVKTYPEIDFLSSLAPQSASLYLSKINPWLPSKIMPKLWVSLRYLSTLFAADSWIIDELKENWEIWEIAYARFGLMHNIAYIWLSTFDWYYFWSIIDSSVDLTSFMSMVIDMAIDIQFYIPNRSRIMLIYPCWRIWSILFLRSRSTWISRKYCNSPIFFISNFILSCNFSKSTLTEFLPNIIRSSIHIAMIMSMSLLI